VPISRLAEAVVQAKETALASGLTSCIVGHVGDGNFHCLILFPEGDQDGLERAWALDRAIVAQGLALGGTCSGEHGIGMGKREKLVAEFGAETVELMRAVKNAWDPRGIMNPGKMFL
jgi:D-lactate dehydrogenase (cytochrome)